VFWVPTENPEPFGTLWNLLGTLGT
jgi:hypothetical protein